MLVQAFQVMGYFSFLELQCVVDYGAIENLGDNSLPYKIIWLAIVHLFWFLCSLFFILIFTDQGFLHFIV